MELIQCHRTLWIDTSNEATHFGSVPMTGQRDAQAIASTIDFLSHYDPKVSIPLFDFLCLKMNEISTCQLDKVNLCELTICVSEFVFRFFVAGNFVLRAFHISSRFAINFFA